MYPNKIIVLKSVKSEALNTYYVFAKSLQKLEMFHKIEILSSHRFYIYSFSIS